MTNNLLNDKFLGPDIINIGLTIKLKDLWHKLNACYDVNINTVVADTVFLHRYSGSLPNQKICFMLCFDMGWKTHT